MLQKRNVNYSEGMGEDRCRNCVHFESPNRCEIVDGLIKPNYWCNKFRMNQDGPSTVQSVSTI